MSTGSKQEQLQSCFSDIVKKAYERGMNEQEVTVQKLIEELKNDLESLVGQPVNS